MIGPFARRAASAVGTAIAAATLATAGVQAAPSPSPGEMALGDPRAPVTVVEYGSVGCPHCAEWANEVFPEFRHKYVETGKARFVFREMLAGNGALAAAGFLTARCAAPDKYFQVIDDVFAQQAEISRVGVDALARIAEHAGVDHRRFVACLEDKAALKALADRTQADAKAHGVEFTPTFFVDDKRLDGDNTLGNLEAAIARARAVH